MLDNHVINSCSKAKPGVPPDVPVDPRPYQEFVQKNVNKLSKKSANSKVVVEDDFIEPNDFRDPGNRKKSVMNSNNASQA